jgi:hypothetical protein
MSAPRIWPIKRATVSDDRIMRRLALTAEFLSDLERVRIANDNRIRALRDDLEAGDEREAQTSIHLAEVFAAAEHSVELDLKRILRQTDLGAFVQNTVGLGEKQVSRLLGTIGHPRWRYDNEADEWHPRTVGQLWSYCGYSVVPAGGHPKCDVHSASAPGVAPARRRGQQASYNTEARTRAFLIAESCVKQLHSPYRKVYDDGRAKYAEAVHKIDCVRCGPSGHPAKTGTPLSDGHKHARALRLVAKAVLKDLWIMAEPSTRREPSATSLAA